MTNHDLSWLRSQQPQAIGGGEEHRAHDRALRTLVRHTRSLPASRGLRLVNPFRSRMFGLTAAAGLAAIAAAVVLSIGGTGAVQPRGAGRHQAASAGSPLARLADYVSTSATPAGDATLVARTTSSSSGSITVYDLYADNGQYFFSPEQSGLQAQVDAHHNLAGGLFAREIAAAREAATGNVQTAAQDMAQAPAPNHVIPRNPPIDQAIARAKLDAEGVKATGKDADVPTSLFDNYAWEDSLDALTAGAGDPQVRAGVLQILATIPGVTVTQGTSDGQPTLVLTAGAQEVGPGYNEQLTINADTGVPIQFVGGSTGGTRATTIDYKVSRVTFAGLSSGTGTATSQG